jgi:hypothetical protein
LMNLRINLTYNNQKKYNNKNKIILLLSR